MPEYPVFVVVTTGQVLTEGQINAIKDKLPKGKIETHEVDSNLSVSDQLELSWELGDAVVVFALLLPVAIHQLAQRRLLAAFLLLPKGVGEDQWELLE